MKSLFQRWRGRPARPAGAQALATPAACTFRITMALHTDTGPVRTHNEDSIAALESALPGRPALVALADGMGGHRAGALASRLAIEAALQHFGQGDGPTPQRLLGALDAANERVYQRAAREPEVQGMGTTMLLVAPHADGVHTAWVGDSRLYRWHDGELVRITRDDTVVGGLVERGLLDAAQAQSHPDHSVLTQAVGTRERIPAPHLAGPLPLCAGDRWLLCSDGVHDVLDDSVLAELLAAPGTPQAQALVLHQRAVAAGASDNLSIAVLHVEPARTPRPARPTRDLVEVQP